MTLGPSESVSTVELAPTPPDHTVRFLLEHFGLPTEDLHEPEVQLYRATIGTEIVGIGGFEIHDDDALLRSIAVKPAAGGQGYGSQICDGLEIRIQARQCNAIYLLTTDAEPFFDKIGYERIKRESAPKPIQQTIEFAELCPTTAICMKKTI